MNKSVTHKTSYTRKTDDTLDEMNIAAQLASQASANVAKESAGKTKIVRAQNASSSSSDDMGGAGAVSGANAAAQPQTRIVRADLSSVDDAQDSSLRPKSLSEFLGQSAIKENLGVFIDAARKRQEALDHLFLIGPPGLGKTTLAQITACELGADFKEQAPRPWTSQKTWQESFPP